MQPWEWDAWRAWRRWSPRFDPWTAMAMTCQVILAGATGEEVPIETFLPKLVRVAKGRKRKPRRREMTVEDFDRRMGI